MKTGTIIAGRGCCSHHGGQNYCDTSVGRWVCNDGTYSPSCTCQKSNDNKINNNSSNNNSNKTIIDNNISNKTNDIENENNNNVDELTIFYLICGGGFVYYLFKSDIKNNN